MSASLPPNGWQSVFYIPRNSAVSSNETETEHGGARLSPLRNPFLLPVTCTGHIKGRIFYSSLERGMKYRDARLKKNALHYIKAFPERVYREVNLNTARFLLQVAPAMLTGRQKQSRGNTRKARPRNVCDELKF